MSDEILKQDFGSWKVSKVTFSYLISLPEWKLEYTNPWLNQGAEEREIRVSSGN